MKVLVGGGAGFIGSHIAKRLKDAGYHVVRIDPSILQQTPVSSQSRVDGRHDEPRRRGGGTLAAAAAAFSQGSNVLTATVAGGALLRLDWSSRPPPPPPPPRSFPKDSTARPFATVTFFEGGLSRTCRAWKLRLPCPLFLCTRRPPLACTSHSSRDNIVYRRPSLMGAQTQH